MKNKKQAETIPEYAPRTRENLKKFAQTHLSVKKQERLDVIWHKLTLTWHKMIVKFIRLSSTLGLARFLSWASFIVIIVFSIFLSAFVGTTNRNSLLESQESYTLLMAENLNKQIFRRFTLPVAYTSGRVALSNPDQYKLLEEIISSLLHGLSVQKIRIFDTEELVSFSTNKEEVQRTDLTSQGVTHSLSGNGYYFEIESRISYFEALFQPDLDKESFILKIFYPMTIDYGVGPFNLEKLNVDGKAPVLGALEITQDITPLYTRAIQLQWSIFLGFLAAITVLIFIVIFIVRTAERIIRERMEQNKTLERELQQSEKLASMGQMVASIAHEVRNPLGIIKSSSEFLLNRKDLDTTEKKLISAIFDETSRLSITVNDFLDYARPRKPGNDSLDLVLVIQKVWDFLQVSYKNKNITVEFHLPDSLPFGGDQDALYRAFYNIFSNAEQAMTDDLNVEQFTFDVIGFMNKNGQITLRFIDNGCGFPEDVDKLLDPFFTTKEFGTGLGLAITKSIINAHQGEIYLYNSDEGGAVVEVIFEPLQ